MQYENFPELFRRMEKVLQDIERVLNDNGVKGRINWEDMPLNIMMLIEGNKRKSKPKPKIRKRGMINWDGGDCPAPPNRRVRILFRNGGEMESLSHYLIWDHKGLPGDIVAYKLLDPE